LPKKRKKEKYHTTIIQSTKLMRWINLMRWITEDAVVFSKVV
jgi:hypothetical protein